MGNCSSCLGNRRRDVYDEVSFGNPSPLILSTCVVTCAQYNALCEA